MMRKNSILLAVTLLSFVVACAPAPEMRVVTARVIATKDHVFNQGGPWVYLDDGEVLGVPEGTHLILGATYTFTVSKERGLGEGLPDTIVSFVLVGTKQ